MLIEVISKVREMSDFIFVDKIVLFKIKIIP